MTESDESTVKMPGPEAMDAIMCCALPLPAGARGPSGLTIVPYTPEAITCAGHENMVCASLCLKLKKITLAIDPNLQVVFVDREGLTGFVKQHPSMTDTHPTFSELYYALAMDGFCVADVFIQLDSGQLKISSTLTRNWWRRLLHLRPKWKF